MALGQIDVDGMLDGIPSTLLTEWKAFYKLEPFGEWRADLRAGRVASVIANVNRNPKKKTTPFTPLDFMPDFTKIYTPESEKSVSIAELKMKMQAIATAFNPKPKPVSKRTK